MEKKFEPTLDMIKFVEACSNPDFSGDFSVAAEAANLSPGIFRKWQKRWGHEFLQWFCKEMKTEMEISALRLDLIGLKKAQDGDFKFYDAINKKYGRGEKKEAEDNDFSHRVKLIREDLERLGDGEFEKIYRKVWEECRKQK